MGNDFGLKVGMTTQQVLNSISGMAVTDKTKQFIIDFCKNDFDKVITDEVELHVLNIWAKGQEKIPMPEIKSSGNKDICVQTRKDRVSVGKFFDKPNGSRKNTSITTLFDDDKDGYADRYTSFSYPDKVQSKGIDDNLDGEFDFIKEYKNTGG